MVKESEQRLIRDYIILPIAITIVNKNRIELKDSHYTLRTLYASVAAVILNQMRADLDSVRRQLKELHISIINTKERHDTDCVYYPYLYHGQRFEFMLKKEAAKLEISRLLQSYVTDMMRSDGFSGSRQ